MSDSTNQADPEKIRFNMPSAEQRIAYTWQEGKNLDTSIGVLKVEKVLGAGGFGIVYLVYNENKRCLQALKTLKAQWQVDESVEVLKQYLREEAGRLQTLTHLTSDSIVKVRDITEYQIKDKTGIKQTLPFVLMDYIEGESLEKDKGKLSSKKAIRYIRQIAEGLIPVHDVEMYHRDIKPQNIIIKKPEDVAVLVDFGASRSIRDQTNFTKISTEEYAAPEQKIKDGKEGSYTDIYALGRTLEVLIKGYPDSVNPQLLEAIKKATEDNIKKIGDRPQSVQEWLDMFPEASPNVYQVISNAVTKHQSFDSYYPQKSSPLLTRTAIGLSVVGGLWLFSTSIKLPISPPPIAEEPTEPINPPPRESPPETVISEAPKTPSLSMKPYLDSEQGFRVSYPDDWGFQDAETLDFDGTLRSPVALQLLPPSQDIDTDISKLSRVYVEILPNLEPSLNDLANKAIADIKEQFRQPEVNSKSVEVKGQPAYELVFSGKVGQEHLKKIQIIKTGGDRQYLITYEGLSKNFPIFESEANAILDTFELISTP